MTRSRLTALLLLCPSITLAASDGGAPLEATASCERKATKGRVICDVELESTAARIAWADVVVTDAPAFAPPLRSRVGMADARARTERRVRLPVALIATSLGRGVVKMRARAVLCLPGDSATAETCRPATKDVSADIVVGTDVEH
ncbi:MAG TPA: hypothetical protein VH062_08520 [Polyangiaceae bacterium]|jgi:hypothetical protein|nr:hypothetical protein [Polyangiaceae bacterium]